MSVISQNNYDFHGALNNNNNNNRWRDQGLAEGGSLEAQVSPCYLNRIDAAEVPFGWGKFVSQAFRVWMENNPDYPNASLLTDCLAPPLKEYEFPRDLFAY